jgi:ankyrin repeat protein
MCKIIRKCRLGLFVFYLFLLVPLLPMPTEASLEELGCFEAYPSLRPTVGEGDKRLEIREQFLPYHGLGALYSQFLEGVRLNGLFLESPKVGIPSLAAHRRIHEGLNDHPQDWLSAFIQYLFPSINLGELNHSSRSKEIAYKLSKDKALIGKLVRVMMQSQLQKFDEDQVRGAVYSVLNTSDFNKCMKKLKSKTKGIVPKLYPKWGSKETDQEVARRNAPVAYKEIGQKLKKSMPVTHKRFGDPTHRPFFATLMTEAFLESQRSRVYSANCVPMALWALAWKTSDSFKQFQPSLEAFCGPTFPRMDQTKLHALQYSFEKDYKEASTQRDIMARVARNPYFSTFIGGGSAVYDAFFPKTIAYSEVKNITYGVVYSDCGTTSGWNFINGMIWDPARKAYNLSKLRALADLKGVSYKFTSEEMASKLPPKGAPLRRLIWFYTKYPRQTKTMEARQAMSEIFSGLKGVRYLKKSNHPPYGEAVVEIAAGGTAIDNMLIVLGNLIPDDSFLAAKTRKDRFKALGNFFSSKGRIFQYQMPSLRDGKDSDIPNVETTVVFNMNGRKALSWEFKSGHFEFQSYGSDTFWQTEKFSEYLCQDPLVLTPSLSLFSGQSLPKKHRKKLTRDGEAFLASLFISKLSSQEGKKSFIQYVIEEQKTDLYPLLNSVMKRMPLGDEHTAHYMRHVLYEAELRGDEALKKVFGMNGFVLESLLKKSPYAVEFIKVLEKKGGSENHSRIGKVLKGLSGYERRVETSRFVLRAIKESNIEKLKAALESGFDLNKSTLHTPLGNQTLLFAATMFGDSNAVNFLLSQGALPDLIIAEHKVTPLFNAVANGRYEISELLLEAGADLEKKCGGRSVLDHAASSFTEDSKLKKVLEYCFAHGVKLHPEKVGRHRSLLHKVAKDLKVESLKVLLKQIKDVQKEYPTLLLALLEYDLDAKSHLQKSTPDLPKKKSRIISTLLKAGCLLPGAEEVRREALTYRHLFLLLTQGGLENLKAVINMVGERKILQDEYSKLMRAAIKYGHIDSFFYLSKLTKTNLKERPDLLIEAARAEKLDVVKTLMASGVDINAPHEGRHAIDQAVVKNNMTIVRALMEQSVDLVYGEEGKSVPLYYAIFLKREEMVKLFLKSSSFDTVSRENRTKYLNLAIKKLSFGTVKMLVEAGFPVNGLDKKSDGSLHQVAKECCHKNKQEIVKYLISKGARLDFRNARGKTAAERLERTYKG